MTCPDIREEILEYDINIFQETRLEEGQMDMVEELEGYAMWSVERVYKREEDDQWGGVAVIAREELGLKKNAELGSADIMVLESESVVLVAAYILPEGSTWETFANVHPFDRLVEVMTLLRDDPRRVVVMGDLNARVGQAVIPPRERRVSADNTTTVRGRALLRVCRSEGFHVLNGLEGMGERSGEMTSHHDGVGEAVVDYAIGNDRLLMLAMSLEVRDRRSEWSDHSELVLRVEGLCEKRRREKGKGRVPRRRRNPGDLYGDGEIDRLVLAAIESIPDPGEEVKLLYGSAYCTTNPVQVYVDGSSLGNGNGGASAGSGVYFGPGNKRNAALRVPGDQTNNRAEVYAVLCALKACNVHQAVEINCDSEYVINMLTEWAPGQQATGWRTVNGDVFKDVVLLIRTRPAPVVFRKVKAHSGNAHNDAADALAKEGATKPIVPPYDPVDRRVHERTRCRCEACTGRGMAVSEEKVSWNLRKRRGGEVAQYAETEEEARSALTAVRVKERERQMEARARLLGAKGPLEFYKEFGALRAPRSKVESVFGAEDLREVFEARMNPIMPPPTSFDEDRMDLNRQVAAAVLQDGLEDETPLRSLSRPFEMEELEDAKLALKKRWGSAQGEDRVTYRDICRMDNDCLLELVNRCVEKVEVPSAWLRTQLVGLCKKGKPKDEPGSYRTIGLESCFLKLLTGMVKDRLVEMVDSLGLLPPSQNGFREGYRTNNNVFILRSAAEKAQAKGTPLYAAFVDLTNAFPSTDQDTLWLKLRKWGAGGPLFDWLRKLYRDMRYRVFHEGEMSREFASTIGILIGDTCSPVLWALYMADLPEYIPVESGDVQLGQAVITHLEQADDVVLLATTAEGLRRKLAGMYEWCAKNFMQLNAAKSAVMIVGTKPRDTPEFWVGSGTARVEIEVMATVTYLGIELSARPGCFMRLHYTAKAEKAQRAARVIRGVQQLVGTLPVPAAARLYMALVDPHLTHGCEVAVDYNMAALEELERVQNGYWRKVLRVGMRCMDVILATETGIIPIRYRRLEFDLIFLLYASQCPRGHYVREAFEEVVRLDFDGHNSWISDLRRVVQGLPFRCPFPTHELLGDAEVVGEMITLLKREVRGHLQRLVDASPKLYLLHGRKELDGNGCLSRDVAVLLRHYLKVNNPAHRIALSKVLLSGHKYAVETLRRGRRPVTREERLCRLCGGAVETPEHVWLECGARDELRGMRYDMARDVLALCTPREAVWLAGADGDPLEQMKRLTSVRGSISRVAQYAHEVGKFMSREVDW